MESVAPKRIPLGRFFLALALVWLVSWLPIGLYLGDPDFVLTTVSRGSVYRQLYQGLLYCGLIAVFLDFWRRYAPELPKRGRPRELASYLLLGLVGAGVLKLALFALGARGLPSLPASGADWLLAAVSALAVAIVEEAVFRGFVLGGMAQKWGAARAVVVSSLLFASVHLFRPGTVAFKLGYGIGLFLLAVMLGRLAWRRSIAASAGFHAGVIFWNFVDQGAPISASWWAGWQNEASSGALAWLFTLLLWLQWEAWTTRPTTSRDARPLDDASLP